ncbi:redox-sensing transcriptional repressor [Carnobacterium iners]|uniref:Redox-sensing transcriptional repressor Rex n=1 Tax=Carnobacterium iners TaxID=1073423 RepID=A0A1X7NQ24_9LACT|nr:redox-sensing transcriptional repressor Rex [Carnobacterium iners]SEK31680.1 redox-sensing transcriptional repressor [Carnobacterium iners]SMH39219.1 redox-sensing transcriptional repressor [Carnobacterium iners]
MKSEQEEHYVPRATAKRLPVYYRCLKKLADKGVKRIKSQEISELTQIPSATIRRDFSHFGELGRSGYGYEVDYVLEVFHEILNVNKIVNIALVGVGNIGKALIANNFRRDDNMKITCAFEKNEEESGKILSGVPIYSIDQMRSVLSRENIHVAISTVPSEYSQESINMLVDSGITSILNFAPGRVVVPSRVDVRYIDLTGEILTLVYYDGKLLPPTIKR